MTGMFVLSIILTVAGWLLWANRPAHRVSSDLITDKEHESESLLLWTKNRSWSLSLIALFAVATAASTWAVVKTLDSFEKQFGTVVCLTDWVLLVMFAGAFIYWNFLANKKKGN
jgi:hypothetical protein